MTIKHIEQDMKEQIELYLIELIESTDDRSEPIVTRHGNITVDEAERVLRSFADHLRARIEDFEE